MPELNGLRFVYGEPAAILGSGRSKTLAVGDLHIGAERRLLNSGVKLYGATERMAASLKRIAESFRVKRIAILGDIKDSLFYPDVWERNSILRFFNALDGYDITLIRGNHDAHLENMGFELEDESLLKEFALLHGNRWPSPNAMQKSYIVTAHNHAAVSFTDSNGAIYREKAWMISGVNPKNASGRYSSFNMSSRLVMMPAFNDLILGMEARSMKDKNTSPLLSNRIFNYRKADVYTLNGDMVRSGGKG